MRTSGPARLRSFFGELNWLGLPVVVYLQTGREDFGGTEVDVFVDRVLPVAPEIPVQVAHMGGNSRFDPPTERAVAAFGAAFEDHPERTANVYFDMGLVPFPLERARGDTAKRKRYERWNRLFAEAVRPGGSRGSSDVRNPDSPTENHGGLPTARVPFPV